MVVEFVAGKSLVAISVVLVVVDRSPVVAVAAAGVVGAVGDVCDGYYVGLITRHGFSGVEYGLGCSKLLGPGDSKCVPDYAVKWF